MDDIQNPVPNPLPETPVTPPTAGSIVADTTPTPSPVTTLPVVEPTLTPPTEAPVKRSNKGLFIIIAVILLALALLGGVTFLALQNKPADQSTSEAPSPTQAVSQSTPTPTPDTGVLSSSDKTTVIQKELDQTTITDPATEIKTLEPDISQL